MGGDISPADDPRFAPLDDALPNDAPAPKKETDTITATFPVPAEAPPIPRHPSHGAPSKTWPYYNAQNELVGHVCRFDIINGTRKKYYSPVVWATSTKFPEPRWRWKDFPKPRPTYNLPALLEHPDYVVLVTEGEKACDAARQYLPANFVAITWPGGTSRVTAQDWSILTGRQVVYWPDNDEPGKKCANDFHRAASRFAASVAVISLPSFLPPKWDLADPLPAELTPAACRALIESALQPVTETPLDETSASPDTAGRAYIALGHRDQRFYFLSRGSQTVIDFTSANLCQPSILNELCPDPSHWYRLARSSDWFQEGQKMDWTAVGAMLVKMCYDAGPYTDECVRGRGAWTEDDGSPVIHLGDRLIHGDRTLAPVEMTSRYVYPGAEPLLPSITSDLPEPATARDGQNLRAVLQKINWVEPISAHFLGGWIFTALVCGAMPWRPHLQLQAKAGSGKSWTVNEILGPIFGDLAIWPIGASTAPGIARWLRQDARPVIFDEAEGKGSFGRTRMEAILELIRQSSGQSRGRIVKAEGAGVASYNIRSSFLLSSIGVGFEQAADLRRITVLQIRPADQSTPAARAASERSFAALRAAVATLPRDIGPRLFVRAVQQIPNILASAQTFASILARELGGRPIGDQLGTLLAGSWCLQNDGPVPDAVALQFVKSQSWDAFSRSHDAQEDDDILRQITQTVLTISIADSRRTDRTIGELCALLVDPNTDPHFPLDTARRSLGRAGLVFTRPDNPRITRHPALPAGHPAGFWLSTTSGFLQRTLLNQDSAYATGWARVVAQHAQAIPSGNTPVLFSAGARTPAIWLPATALLPASHATGEYLAGTDLGDPSDAALTGQDPFALS